MDSERLNYLHRHTELKSKGSILFGTKPTPGCFSVPWRRLHYQKDLQWECQEVSHSESSQKDRELCIFFFHTHKKITEHFRVTTSDYLQRILCHTFVTYLKKNVSTIYNYWARCVQKQLEIFIFFLQLKDEDQII